MLRNAHCKDSLGWLLCCTQKTAAKKTTNMAAVSLLWSFKVSLWYIIRTAIIIVLVNEQDRREVM